MPPPHNGNERLPFAQLVQLEKIDSNTFQSVALPFTPRGRPRDGDGKNDGKNDDGVAYGGHVFMQAAWAACRTVPGGDGDGDGRRGFLLSVSVFFLFTFFGWWWLWLSVILVVFWV